MAQTSSSESGEEYSALTYGLTVAFCFLAIATVALAVLAGLKYFFNITDFASAETLGLGALLAFVLAFIALILMGVSVERDKQRR